MSVRSATGRSSVLLQSLESRQLLAAGPVLWAHDPNRNLYTVDVSTGVTKVMGRMPQLLYDIAFDKSGQLWGIDSSSNLYKVNKSTAATTRVGNFGKFANSLVFSPTGTLYAAGQNSFFSINTTTAARTDIADLDGRSSAGDLAFDGAGRLFLSTTNGFLNRIDVGTGTFTPVGDTKFKDVFGMAYGPDGVMYGLSNRTREIFKLNLSTGAGTLLSTLDAKVTGVNGSSFFAEAARPEVEVRGNNVVIADGDSTPSAADHTDFGSVAVSGASVTRTFTIRNTGLAALTLGTVTIGGANASDFVVTKQPGVASLAPGASATFNVKFDPSAAGVRNATVSFANSDADENPYNFAIKGNGGTVTANGATVSVLAVDPYAAENQWGDPSSGMIRVSRSGSTAASLTVTLAISGNATLSSDYGLKVLGAQAWSVNAATKTLSITFGAGVSSVSVLVTALNDNAAESSEQATLTLNAGAGYAIDAAKKAGTVNVVDR
jgi:hypothetical protein